MSARIVYLSRDPFARSTVVRRIEVSYRGCGSCGGHRGGGRSPRTLFRYGVEHDSIARRTDWDDRLFCCQPCRDQFYG